MVLDRLLPLKQEHEKFGGVRRNALPADPPMIIGLPARRDLDTMLEGTGQAKQELKNSHRMRGWKCHSDRNVFFGCVYRTDCRDLLCSARGDGDI